MEEDLSFNDFEKMKNKVKKIYEDMRISINKEFNELKTMIKDEIGENKNYYRISLIAELIEKDVNEIIDQLDETIKIQENLKKTLELNDSQIKEVSDDQNKLFELLKKETGIDFDKTFEISDPVSEIVKDVNTLNLDQQKFLMHYVKGYSANSNQNKKFK